MITYREREEKLFAKWMQACKEIDGINPQEDFAYDGLLFRGEFKLINGCWERQPGNESELWDKAPCRLLILTKDTTRNGALEDIRIETARKNHTGDRVETFGASFYRNLTLWAYALQNALTGGDITSYDDAPDWDQLREHYESAAIARVNCKKQIGASSIPNPELKAHMERYSDFLKEQVAMYDADVILCCGNQGDSNVIKDFIHEAYLPDLVKVSEAGWVYCSPSTNKVVIDTFHPTARKKFKQMYDDMMADLRTFLDSHPGFRFRAS